ncbi:ABC transporter substrate-binding protein [Candidatus Woesearchaeota archaeon]|nr:ABC transporter substrate-binding protein [Candidatus Woesearchaeota archaeon]
MNSITKIALAIFMCLIIMGCGSQTITGKVIEREQTIKVGFIAPLTVLAEVGEEMRNGVELALDDVNDPRLKIIIEDGQCQPKPAVNAAQKLMTVDKVIAIIGPACTTSILPVAPLANHYKTPIIGTVDSSEDIGKAGEYVFSAGFSVEDGAKLMANFAYTELDARTASLLYDTDDWAQVLTESFKQEFEMLGGTVLDHLHHDISSKDYRTELLKMKHSNPDVLYTIPLTLDGTILRQARELKLTQTFLGADSFGIESVIEGAGPAAEGTFFSYQLPYNQETEDKLETLRQKYLAKFGKEPFNLLYVGMAYDNVVMLSKILKHAKTSEEVKDALAHMEPHQGFIGVIDFDERGLASRPQFINTIHNNEFESVDFQT